MGDTQKALCWPATTGELSRRLAASETRIADAIRRGRVPPPPVRAGRRLWRPQEVRALAQYLGRLTPELAAELDVASPAGGRS